MIILNCCHLQNKQALVKLASWHVQVFWLVRNSISLTGMAIITCCISEKLNITMAIITCSSILVSEKLNITNWHGYYHMFKCSG